MLLHKPLTLIFVRTEALTPSPKLEILNAIQARVALNRTGAVTMFERKLSDVEAQIAYFEGRLAEQALLFIPTLDT